MIRYARQDDFEWLSELDGHISGEELSRVISLKRVIVAESEGKIIGWLRYGLFWDNIPFMNMLFVVDEERGKGYGTALAEFWESEMLRARFDQVLTSTLSDEQGQFFFRKRGYKDCGSLILPGEPLEIILLKEPKQ